ncbi:MAG: NADP-binding protein [Candidatus Hodarchaeota archaeon]
MKKVKVILYGVGVVGSNTVKMIVNKSWIEIVGAIDINEEKVGKDLGEVVGVGRRLGVIISDEPETVFSNKKADVVLHSTSFTSTEETKVQLLMAMESGANVISTTDSKLSYPWVHWPELGRTIDEVAKKNGVTFLYTGINPTFTMELMTLVTTGICASVKKIVMNRIVDVAPYGEGVLKYLGIGRTTGGFYKGLVDGSVGGTIPLTAPQIDMVADTIGWQLEQDRTAEPSISKKAKMTSYGVVLEPGIVCGAKWVYHGMKGGEEVITFEFTQVMNAAEEGVETGNHISILGHPNVEVFLKESRADIANSASLVNAIPQVIDAKPGLLTVKDLAIVTVLK